MGLHGFPSMSQQLERVVCYYKPIPAYTMFPSVQPKPGSQTSWQVFFYRGLSLKVRRLLAEEVEDRQSRERLELGAHHY